MKKIILTIQMLAFLGGAYTYASGNEGGRISQEDYKKYIKVKLTTDFSKLEDWEKDMLGLLVEAAKVMDDIFWKQSFYGNRDSLLKSAKNEEERQYLILNYGPWDRLNGNKPFKEGYGQKPKGANFYPLDMTVEEFNRAEIENKKSLYTVIRRDKAGKLKSIEYSSAYKKDILKAVNLLNEAAEVCQDEQLCQYLRMRAIGLQNNWYEDSDRMWLEMQENKIDVIIGPIENYEDQLFGYKTAYEAYILVKDLRWSAKLKKYTSLLPQLQESLPVEPKYKSERPGMNSQLAVFDVLYYAGDCNAGSKTIAVNLPNDEKLQLEMGTRRSQLKNAMKAKFDHILLPISKELIADEQQKHINFEAFFSNTMFHEVAHGLGIKKTITDNSSVRLALKNHASALEEGKADILGLYMVSELIKNGQYEGENTDIMDSYVTFMASIFRSVRFGAASAHGKANMIRFNFFSEMGAFERNEETGKYKVNKEKMEEAVAALSALILKIQGDGDYAAASTLVKEKGIIKPGLQSDLDRLKAAGIPVDVVFDQGPDVWGEMN